MPILGSGDSGILCNCRQISSLPQFSKILEELNEGRLYRFLEKNELLCDNQYGFRQNGSTVTALVNLMEFIYIFFSNLNIKNL